VKGATSAVKTVHDSLAAIGSSRLDAGVSRATADDDLIALGACCPQRRGSRPNADQRMMTTTL
jgi:hypothetical protein